MGETKINIGAIQGLSSQASEIKARISEGESDFRSAKNSVSSRVMRRSNLSYRASEVLRDISSVESRVARITALVSKAASSYDSVERNIVSNARCVSYNRMSSKGSISSGLGVGAAAGFFDIGDASAKVKQGIGYIYDEVMDAKSAESTKTSGAIKEIIAEAGGGLHTAFLKTALEISENKIRIDSSEVEITDGKNTLDYINSIFERTKDKVSLAKDYLKYTAESGATWSIMSSLVEVSKASLSSSSSVFHVSDGQNKSIDLLCQEFEESFGLFNSASAETHALKITDGKVTESFSNTKVEEKLSLDGSGLLGLLGIDKGNGKDKKDKLKYDKDDNLANFLNDKKEKAEDALNKKLEKHNLSDKQEETWYEDKKGNEVKKEDAPTFYEKEATIAEIKKEASASVNLYEKNGNWVDTEWAKASGSVTVAEAEAHASIAGGFYVVGANGEKKFSPGINAECGASVTAFNAKAEGQLGNDMIGINGEAEVTLAKAEAKAEAGVQFLGKDGKLDVQLGASASAEAILAEVEGSVGVNVLGGEVEVSGGINFGVGAHADVGYRDGVFKFDVGASLGVGVSLDLEVDVGGMVNTACDAAEAAWDWITFWD